MIETEVSIDRLTIIAYDTGMMKSYLKNSGYITGENFSRNYGFRHAYHCQNGELIELGDKQKVRIDFNPNTANMEQIEDILSRLKYPHLTRLDIAVDYYDKDFSNVEWTSIKLRKRNYWTDGYGALETLYIGAPKSDKRFRIYDKLKERADKTEQGEWGEGWNEYEELKKKHDIHWRVEVQKRFKESDNILDPTEYLLHDLFDIRPVAKNVDLNHIEKFSERMIVAGLLERPEELKKADKKTRAKYKKLIQEAQERAGKVLDIEPHEVYEKEKSRLAGELNDLFNKCLRVTLK